MFQEETSDEIITASGRIEANGDLTHVTCR